MPCRRVFEEGSRMEMPRKAIVGLHPSRAVTLLIKALGFHLTDQSSMRGVSRDYTRVGKVG